MLAAAVLFAAIFALLLFVWLQSRDGGGGGEAAITTDVVVASQDISANTVLTAEMLTVRSVPADEALAGAYSSVETVVGLPVRYPVQAGEQITTARVGIEAIKEEKDLAYVLKPGMRAVAVEVTEVTSVGGLLLPGNFVDLIVVIDGGEEGLADNKAVTLLENVEVLAVAQEAQQPVPAAGAVEGEEGDTNPGSGVSGQRPDEVERQPRARTVTVAVTPLQAQLLAFIQADDTSGDQVHIMLSLRPVGETEERSLPDFLAPRELIVPATQ
jgi:pilus assembly protein CpaB